MQASVTGLVAEAQAIMQQGRDAAGRADVGEATLAAVNARTRETVQRVAGDLFERRIFDPYLQFASAEDEEAYRKREAERQEYIRRELTKGTPEGNLNATIATREQIEDAGAHGADRSPDYQRLLSEVETAEDALRSATSSRDGAQATGQPDTTPASPKEPEGLTDILNALRDAGVVTAATTGTNPTHGLAVGRPVTPTREV